VKKQLADRKVTTHLPADLPLVKLDGVLIELVLVNLLENAVKYTPPGTSFEIAARVEDQEAFIEVADRGQGLTDDERQRVFDKFYRGLAAAEGQRGAGLGLAISRAAVEAHGGRIWEENRPDGGAKFIFTIPLEGLPPEIDMSIPPKPEG
jgi:two-component system sensor histidine kinase KdpD